MPTRADRSELRASLDANLHGGMGLASLVIGSLLAFFVLADLLTTPAPWTGQVAIADLLNASLFFLAYYALRLGVIQPRHAHPVATMLALSVTADILHDIFLLKDPQQTTYLMLVVVGSGSILLSTRWLYIVVACSLAGWIVVAAQYPQVNWNTFGFALFASCVLSVLIHAVRVNTFERMDALRLAEVGRKEQLLIREEALESAVKALQDSEERYKRLVEGAPDGFLVISKGRIVFANPAAARLFGAQSAADLQGVAMEALIHSDDVDRVRARNAQVLQGQVTEPTEIKCRRLNGSILDVEVIGQPITYLGEPADQTVVRDITDRKRAEAERLVASSRLAEISRLKEMDRVKTQFVNAISHELRTPLTPIKVQLHILKAAKEGASTTNATAVIDRNVTRLSSIVDELLEVARIQAGTLRLARTYVDLGQTVSLALDSYVDVARQKGIEFGSAVEPGIHVLGDEKRLQQVIYNLLGNAFKFTEAGGRVTVDVRRKDEREAIVTVADNGIGMRPEDIARLFEPFSQVHDPMEKTNAGTGLGLYICRGIVEGHGGRIWAESDGRGKGSRFLFTIPLEPARKAS